MSSKILDWKYVLNLMSKECRSCVIAWEGIYQLCLVLSSLWNHVDQDLKKRKNSIGVPCLLSWKSTRTRESRSIALVGEHMSVRCHEIQEKSLFWLFTQSNDLPQDCSAQMEWFRQTDYFPLRQDWCTSSNTLPKHSSSCFLQVQF